MGPEPRYVFYVFGGESLAGPTETITQDFASEALARHAARQLAEDRGHPVDLALDDGTDWDRAYIGTAQPWPQALGGTAFERLD